MDWFSWLSKTSLDPSLVYEYGLAFSHNELEEDDIYYLTHEFLQRMGVSIAKHRLEILKLARKEKGTNKFVLAIKKTIRTFGEFIRTLVRRDESSLILVSKLRYSSKRNNKTHVSNMDKQERLLLTSGNNPLSRIDSLSIPMVYNIHSYDKLDGCNDPNWLTRVEEIKWDAMFQDLKPT